MAQQKLTDRQKRRDGGQKKFQRTPKNARRRKREMKELQKRLKKFV